MKHPFSRISSFLRQLLAAVSGIMARLWSRVLMAKVPQIDRWGGWIASTYALTCYLLWATQAIYPGYCVAALGVGAIIVAARAATPERFTVTEKVIWICIATALVYGEARIVYSDRVQGDVQRALQEEEQQQRFEATVASLQTTVNDSEQLLRTTRGIGSLAEENLEQVTGGNSYAYVTPQGLGAVIPLFLHNYGGQILSGVTVTIRDLQDTNWFAEAYDPIQIGTVPAYGFAAVPQALVPKIDPETGIASYWIDINAQNGDIDEMLQFRKAKQGTNVFAYRLTVRRIRHFDKAGRHIFGPKQSQLLENYGWSDDRPPKRQSHRK